MGWLRRLGLAASYITSVPFLPRPQSVEELSGLSRYLPAVGIFIGLLLFCLFYACRLLDAASEVTALVVVIGWLLITGCLHLDGLMDSADGLFSCRDRKRMLEIMKDSRAGNFGVISGILLILSKLIPLVCLAQYWAALALLILPVWSRCLEVGAIVFYPYAREEGFGKIWHDSSKQRDFVIACLIALSYSLLLCFCLHTLDCLLVIPLAILPGALFTLFVHRLLGGQTGDTYGACVEFSEAAGLILLALIFS